MAETSRKFEMRRPLVMCELNREQLDDEIAKGMADIEEGRVIRKSFECSLQNYWKFVKGRILQKNRGWLIYE